MKKSLLGILSGIVILSSAGCNKSIADFHYQFNYAYVDLPGGQCVEGKVDSWTDFEDGDQLQVTIDGITYLSNSSRIVLVYKR